MNKGFWGKLNKPFFVLAPMADVTDAAFRRMFVKYGKPDVMYTEFVSTDGLCSVGQDNLMKEFWYDQSERPIVAQIWGANPDNFYETAKLISKLGFDGIDINMGCPVRKVQNVRACAALINNPPLAQEIVKATKLGAGKLPVSVKTRIGYLRNEIETWLPCLLEVEPAAIVIHARTKKDMSKTPAKWDVIKRAVEIVDNSETLIIGNGDVSNLGDAKVKVSETGCDGVMLGRAAFGNPWLFNEEISRDNVSVKDKLEVMLEHTKLYEELYNDIKSFYLMRKHMGAYVNGFNGAKELRMKLMKAVCYEDVKKIVDKFEG